MKNRINIKEFTSINKKDIFEFYYNQPKGRAIIRKNFSELIIKDSVELSILKYSSFIHGGNNYIRFSWCAS